jgi:hypothetical protein
MDAFCSARTTLSDKQTLFVQQGALYPINKYFLSGKDKYLPCKSSFFLHKAAKAQRDKDF